MKGESSVMLMEMLRAWKLVDQRVWSKESQLEHRKDFWLAGQRVL